MGFSGPVRIMRPRRGLTHRGPRRLHLAVFDREIIYSLKEARVVIESWRRRYDAERLYGPLVRKPRALRVFILQLGLNRNSHFVSPGRKGVERPLTQSPCPEL